MTFRFAPRAGHLPYWAIGLSIAAAVVAIVPIAAAIFGGVSGAKTAFASAPPGTYVVTTSSGDKADTIYVAPVSDPAKQAEIAKVGHLPGYTPTGAVSPDGRRVALVVADAGTPANPGASVLVVELETGDVTRVAIGAEPRQTPAWTPDGRVVFSRSSGADSPAQTVTFSAVDVNGDAETEIARFDGVLGAYAVGYDPQGRFLVVVIDNRGSTLVRDGTELQLLSSQITRDWELSPDATQIAFIETDVRGGLHYNGRVLPVEGPADGGVAAQALDDGAQELGVAWGPTGLAFGREPGGPQTLGSASAQAVPGSQGGFDVPISYAPDGQALAVQTWSGRSFENAGKMQLEVVRGDSRAVLPGATAVLGWAVR